MIHCDRAQETSASPKCTHRFDYSVVYELTPASNGKGTYTVLHSFSGTYGGTFLARATSNGVISEVTQ